MRAVLIYVCIAAVAINILWAIWNFQSWLRAFRGMLGIGHTKLAFQILLGSSLGAGVVAQFSGWRGFVKRDSDGRYVSPLAGPPGDVEVFVPHRYFKSRKRR